ncbi:type I phosphomannose isomerase catalytic subunit [Candidatus Hepatoplasma crinochetorum]|uniref:type I phosphomannose isomerase catalytic subunit n=1 Tax=Candidatus Hepatoplasma crinochetorum TaxID=295596 RepID=UPI00308652EE|nr:MAG: class I mannose-6-phosphate isomerase [Candidatus Hepatoplasma crinochetorum]
MILKLRPHYVQKIWGGEKIAKIFNFKSNDKIGEAWVVSGIKDNQAKIINQKEEITLDLFYKQNKKLFNNYKTEDFPLLIKFLDAKDDLSIQVHPNNKQAQELENYPYGKSEAWYILGLEKNHEIIIGLKSENLNELKKVNKDNWKKIINIKKIKVGSVFDIKPGTVHAIRKGTFVYEIQQPSDITYRIYDFDRLEQNGKKRQLDLEKSIKVINNDFKENLSFKSEINFLNLKILQLISNKIFNLQKWSIYGNTKIRLNEDERNFLIVTAIEGKGKINNFAIENYQTLILTYDEIKEITLEGNFKLLVANPIS